MFNVAVVLSFLLCVVMAGLWVTSFWARYIAEMGWLGRSPRVESIGIDSMRGILEVDRTIGMDQELFAKVTLRPQQSHFYFRRLPAARGSWRHLGFGYYNGDSARPRVWRRMITMPYWLPVLLLALPPVWWSISAWRKSRIVGPGQCKVCRYDLL